MVNITIDDKQIEVPEGITVIQACELAGVEIPRFCYHEKLSIAGNCRMCLVEMVGGPPKPIASCATQVGEGMVIKTKTETVKKAREGVMEFLLVNHPLDCPICDQGGECDLQDQAFFYGGGESRYKENKRAVKDKYMGPLIKTHMTRCIHCTRCVRFLTEVAGSEELGAVGRGEDMEVSTYIENSLTSELSGNIIDLCPVGALTSKPYAFSARPWELVKTESIDVSDALGSNIRVDARGREVMRILPLANDDINEEWISDKTRFSYDGLKRQRLDRPYLRKDGKLVEASYDEAIEYMSGVFAKLNDRQIAAAGLAGDLADVESVYLLKKLLNKLESSNYDCRPENSNLSSQNRSDYIFNSKISKLDEADLILLIGVNPRTEASVLNARITFRVREGGVKVANIGNQSDFNYSYQQLSDDPLVLEDIVAGKHEYSKQLAAAKKPMIIIGESAFLRTDAKGLMANVQQLAEKYGVINEEWFGLNVLHNAAGRVGALDLGFVPGESEGMSTAEIIANSEKGEIKLVFLLNYDEANVSRLSDALVVYIGSHGDRGASIADVVFPASAFTEKNATYVNTEGRVQKTSFVVKAPGVAKDDWRIIADLYNLISEDKVTDEGELYKGLYSEFPHMAELNLINNDFKMTSFRGYLTPQTFKNLVPDFYRSNPIARSSLVMTKCSKEFVGKQNG